MVKNIIILALLCMPMHNLFARTVVIHKNNFSCMAGHMMHEDSQKARYWIPLQEVYTYLPEQHDIKRRAMKLINQRIIPGKTPIRILGHATYNSKDLFCTDHVRNIFGNLAEDKPHTYVILPDQLIFTESTSIPTSEFYKDKFTKHYIISDRVKKVNYSGEFYVYKNSVNNEIFVVFDNSSGTYQPKTELLPQVQKLLDINLNSPADNPSQKIYIITKTFEQKIDKNKLFNHDSKPFVDEFFGPTTLGQ